MKKRLLILVLSVFFIFSLAAFSSSDTAKILRNGMAEMDVYEILSDYPCDGKVGLKTGKDGQKTLTFKVSNGDAAKLFGMDSLKKIPIIEYVRLKLDYEKHVKKMVVKTELPSYIKNVSCTAKEAKKYMDRIAKEMGADNLHAYGEQSDICAYTGEYHVDYVNILIAMGKPIGKAIYMEIPAPDSPPSF